MLNYILHCRPAEIKTCKSYTVSIHVFSRKTTSWKYEKIWYFILCLLWIVSYTPGEDCIWVVMSCMVYDVLTFTIHRTLSFIWNVEQNSVTLSTSWLGFLFLFTHEEKIISFFFSVTGIPILCFVCLTGSDNIFGVTWYIRK